MPVPDPDSRGQRRGYILLGVVVVAALLIFNLQPLLEATRRTVTVVALVHDAPDVKAGTDVWVEGVRMGRVRNVNLVKREDSVLVALDLVLDREARALVTPSSDVRASRRRFIAEPVVRVFAGSPHDPPLQAGDTLRGRLRLGPTDLLARAEGLGPALDSVMDAARRLQQELERREPAIRRLAGQFEATTAAATALTTQLEAGSVGRMLDGDTGLPAHMAGLRQRLGELRDATDQLAVRYSPDGPLGAEFRGLADRTRALESTLDSLGERIGTGHGFIGRMQADSALGVAVRGVQMQIDSLMEEAFSIALRMFLP
jgi:ABC-type transporter Mla subunit MlaD